MEIYPKKSKKALEAVHLFCAECMGMSRTKKRINIPVEDIKGCTDSACPLFEFRFGKDPFHKGGNRKGASPETLKKARAARKKKKSLTSKKGSK